jgi:drug/metabolite transporter (DMT)-like permease
MAVSLGGVAVFLAEKLQTGAAAASVGDAISLLAALCFAGYNVVNKPLLARHPVAVVMAGTLTAG